MFDSAFLKKLNRTEVSIRYDKALTQRKRNELETCLSLLSGVIDESGIVQSRVEPIVEVSQE